VLTEARLAKLTALFDQWLRNLRLPIPEDGQSERSYTGRVLLPLTSGWVENIGVPSLFVRADGGVPTLPLSLEGMFFYPDIEIVEHGARYIAVEVKFLTEAHSTGALSKAVGQAAMYRSLGFASAQVMVIDLRPQLPSHSVRSAASWNAMSPGGFAIHWYKRDADNRLSNVRTLTPN
jgi:hypothetical protein